jgi:hypothetical protein
MWMTPRSRNLFLRKTEFASANCEHLVPGPLEVLSQYLAVLRFVVYDQDAPHFSDLRVAWASRVPSKIPGADVVQPWHRVSFRRIVPKVVTVCGLTLS